MMAGINSEIFSGDEIDIDSVSSFVQTGDDMNFPVVVDSEVSGVEEINIILPLLWRSLF